MGKEYENVLSVDEYVDWSKKWMKLVTKILSMTDRFG
ncbi:hypothetical protein [Streptococcus equi]|nr:hypothetical protein [Streptococcus equi subsp. zooepidemicus]